MPLFRLCGLTVAADFPLPGVTPLATGGDADIFIRQRAVPHELDDAIHRRAFSQISPDRFLLHVPGIGRFLAVGGRELDMEPAASGNVQDAVPFLLGTGMGAILYQRGALVLHASAVAWGGRAYAFCGPTGAGKSTLAAALCRAGCRLISDDVTALGLDETGRAVVHADSRHLKLFAESIEGLDLQSAQGPRVRGEVEKYHVEPANGGEAAPVPLAAVYQLREVLPPVEPGLILLPAVDSAQVLLNESYRPRIAQAYAGQTGTGAALTAAVLRQVSVHRLTRVRGMERLAGTVDTLMAGWAAGGTE